MWHRQRTNAVLLSITIVLLFKVFLLAQKGELKKGHVAGQLDVEPWFHFEN